MGTIIFLNEYINILNGYLKKIPRLTIFYLQLNGHIWLKPILKPTYHISFVSIILPLRHFDGNQFLFLFLIIIDAYLLNVLFNLYKLRLVILKYIFINFS
jgi:hypothetical protein